MAVSASTDFNLTAHDLIIEARKKIGIHESEEPLSAADRQSGLKSLNIMLKAWQAKGVAHSLYAEGSIAMGTAGVQSYSFGTGGDFTTTPLSLELVRISVGGIETPMQRLTRSQYKAIPLKTTQGRPNSWYYERKNKAGTLYVWPTTNTTTDTLKFDYVERIDDMDANANDLDLPAEWYEAVVYGLANELSVENGLVNTPLGQYVHGMARETLQDVKDFDISEGAGSLFILPGNDMQNIGGCND